jgi:hypothetical protein
MKIPAPFRFDPRTDDLARQLSELPRTAGVYSLIPGDRPPHLSWSANLPRRLTRLLGTQVREHIESVECWATGSKLETSLLMYNLAKAYFPADYLKRLRLSMPWFVRLKDDPFPRLAVVNRIPRQTGPAFGPFPSRDQAQRYEQEVLGLFQIRRCTETLAPHPEHPGCIYGEIGQCSRPCQNAVTSAEYANEVARVAEFLSTNGKSTVAGLSAAREAACERTDFEGAAEIHKRIERVKSAAALCDEAVAEIRNFNGVALTRGAQPLNFRLWPMLAGLWQEPVTLNISLDQGQAKSLDQELRERLSDSLASPRRDGSRIEELALFRRWYFSSWRDGQWYAFRSLGELNYRKLVREISKLAVKA